jgi:hypothetical protein
MRNEENSWLEQSDDWIMGNLFLGFKEIIKIT